MTSVDPTLIAGLVQRLTDRSVAMSARDFPAARPEAANPGLYAWWPDEVAAQMLADQLGELLPTPIYVGQAGATSRHSGKASDATLASRVGRNHIGGNLKSSTFRRTIGSILREPLSLQLEAPTRLTRDSNAALTEWIKAHMSISITAVDDGSALADVEHAVLTAIDPPLNLMGMRPTPVRVRLRQLRKELHTP